MTRVLFLLLLCIQHCTGGSRLTPKPIDNDYRQEISSPMRIDQMMSSSALLRVSTVGRLSKAPPNSHNTMLAVDISPSNPFEYRVYRHSRSRHLRNRSLVTREELARYEDSTTDLMGDPNDDVHYYIDNDEYYACEGKEEDSLEDQQERTSLESSENHKEKILQASEEERKLVLKSSERDQTIVLQSSEDQRGEEKAPTSSATKQRNHKKSDRTKPIGQRGRRLRHSTRTIFQYVKPHYGPPQRGITAFEGQWFERDWNQMTFESSSNANVTVTVDVPRLSSLASLPSPPSIGQAMIPASNDVIPTPEVLDEVIPAPDEVVMYAPWNNPPYDHLDITCLSEPLENVSETTVDFDEIILSRAFPVNQSSHIDHCQSFNDDEQSDPVNNCWVASDPLAAYLDLDWCDPN